MKAAALTTLFLLSACASPTGSTPDILADAIVAPLSATGTIMRHADVASLRTDILPRHVDVWLPPSYQRAKSQRYPVIYVQDGQTLFDPALSPISGQDWDIDGTMTRLIASGEIPEAIIVGIWSTDERYEDYMPEAAIRPITVAMSERLAERPRPFNIARMQSDSYLRFVTAELKPAIDGRYRTLPKRETTFVMGASTAGLISVYAAMKYPDVFSASAGLSSHMGSARGAVVDYIEAHPPSPTDIRLYFDYGDQGVDADWNYPAYHARLDSALKAAGFVPGEGYVNRLYPGTGHGELYWSARLEAPLKFLLAPVKTGT